MIRPSHVLGRTLRELSELLGARLCVTDAADALTNILGISLDNRAVQQGDLFAALPGTKRHGASFAQAAAAAGAAGFVTDEAGAPACVATGKPTIVVADARDGLAQLAAEIYGHPSRSLGTFAVTGTNGKTTTSFLLAGLLRKVGRHAGLIGTVQITVGDMSLPAALTTPESPQLQACLATMVEQKMDACVMEVSSHAIAQRRVEQIGYDVVGFTNLSNDHLDFHGDMDSYLATKAELFTPRYASRAVVTIDDKWGKSLAASATIPVVTLSTTDSHADWHVSDHVRHGFGTKFTLVGKACSYTVHVHIPGTFNVANAALAVVMAHEAGVVLPPLISLDTVVPGRMEVVSVQPRVVVDFAHNAEALAAAINALRPTTAGRMLLVFGATGDRDTTKRPAMARAAAGADVVVVTDDDPHGEDATAIRATLVKALPAGCEHVEVAPRADAIAWAVVNARAEDTVLIAGRGHERIQEIAGIDLHLDDREEARHALGRWGER